MMVRRTTPGAPKQISVLFSDFDARSNDIPQFIRYEVHSSSYIYVVPRLSKLSDGDAVFRCPDSIDRGYCTHSYN